MVYASWVTVDRYGECTSLWVCTWWEALGTKLAGFHGFTCCGWNRWIFSQFRQVNFRQHSVELMLHITAWRQDGVKMYQWRALDDQCVHQSMRDFCSFLCKMTTPLTLPVTDQDCVALRKTGDHVCDGRSALWCLLPALSAASGRNVALSNNGKHEAAKGSVQEKRSK